MRTLPGRLPVRDAPAVRRISLLVILLPLLLASRAASAQCATVDPVACPDCFAVFIMPDTQHYTEDSKQPAAGNHLNLVTQYVCDHRSAWTEPTTGKTMPIVMVVQLGDLVQRSHQVPEWERVSAAFETFDSCTPNVPYVVTNGNHDMTSQVYERESEHYSAFFGPDRWTREGYGCSGPSDCDSAAGQYFLGAGDTVPALSRNNVGPTVSPGPATDQIGRHRAAMIRTPNGQPFLFLGIELAFDFAPAAPGQEGIEHDDSLWPRQILEANPSVPTLVFHHSMLWTFGPADPRLRWGPETWNSDSISDPVGDYANDPDHFALSGGMEDLYKLLIEPYPQVRFLFTGHVGQPYHQADYTIARPDDGPPTWAFLRDFQAIDQGLPGDEDRYGAGWNVVAVFDPGAEQVRVRSYRIDDVDNYAQPAPIDYDHDGPAAPTECFDTDQGGVPERILPWDFGARRADAPLLSGAAAAGLAASVLGTTLWSMRRASTRNDGS